MHLELYGLCVDELRLKAEICVSKTAVVFFPYEKQKGQPSGDARG